jgi:hypothetical protein
MHQQAASRLAAPQRNGAPQAEHRSGFCGVVCKARHRLSHECHLLAEIAAAVADGEMNAQPHPLAQTERTVEGLGDETADFLAIEHHFLNQLIFKHSRRAMRAR